MNIKSLLLGSAAAVVAVSGAATSANSADAIIAAAPEPLEYVRVCDAFGTGFFYIPGTETCLRIHGYVRQDIGFGELDGFSRQSQNPARRGDDVLFYRSRLSLRTSTASDTELGTLRTYTETRFTYDNSNAGGSTNTTLNFAWIELGGLRIGKDESVFTTWTGYAGSVINDDASVSYGPFDAQLISYTLDAGNGFSAIISVEDDAGQGGDYVPDVVAGAGYEAGAFQVRVVGGYDESAEEGAVKARLDASFGSFSAFVMGGYSSNEGGNRFAQWGGDYAVWGGFSVPVSDRIDLNTQLAYDEDENFGAVANLVFSVVDGFAVTTEIGYDDNFDIDDADRFGGTIRFQRSF